MNLGINQDVFDGKWKQLRGTIKKQWGDLTDDDLKKVQGRYDQFLGLLQDKYGYSRQTAENEINTRLNDLYALGDQLQTSTRQAVTAVDETVTQRRWLTIAATLLVCIVVGLWLNNSGD